MPIIKNKTILAITMGDPNGIGAEVILKALYSLQPITNWIPIIFGDLHILENTRKKLGFPFKFKSLNKIELLNINANLEYINIYDLADETDLNWNLGECSGWAGKSSFRFLKTALDSIKKGYCTALVTAPLNKEALNKGGVNYFGHTEIITDFFNKKKAWMMLDTGKLRAVMVTLHLGLNDAIKILSQKMISDTINITNKVLEKRGFNDIKIGVAGLNPHAGDNGLFGNEEKMIICPAISKAQKLGLNVSGPFSPDSIFLRHKKGEFDAVVALYHDQALIPLKLLGFGKSVNITLGLPLIRTSVDHGTAFDRATKYNSNPESMISAIKLALKLSINHHQDTI